jgi:hypothetical protein
MKHLDSSDSHAECRDIKLSYALICIRDAAEFEMMEV